MRDRQQVPAEAALVYMPVRAWPDADRAAWAVLFTLGDVFDEAGAARHWALATRRTNAHHYARWLAWLRAEGKLDATALP